MDPQTHVSEYLLFREIISFQELQLGYHYYLWTGDTESLPIVKWWLQVTTDIDIDLLKVWDKGDKVQNKIEYKSFQIYVIMLRGKTH